MHILGYHAVDCSHAFLSRRRWAKKAADQKLYRAVRLNCFFFHHPFKKKLMEDEKLPTSGLYASDYRTRQQQGAC